MTIHGRKTGRAVHRFVPVEIDVTVVRAREDQTALVSISAVWTTVDIPMATMIGPR